MKIIYKIAKAELQILFYSPIAWLILILFTFTASMDLVGLLKGILQSVAMGYPLTDLTFRIFSGWEGILSNVQGNLYLFLPLLTMNLMSRELSSGSIKLLYSSPVTDTQIILGKYLSMVVYAVVLMLVLVCYALYGAATITAFNYQMVLTGILGLFLLTCAYAAIGLFMSSLTAYQVVAAIGTLTIFSILNYISMWGQDIAFVRELTYWLAMPGRCNEFVFGMVSTEGLLYFVLVIVLFLTMAILRLQSRRTHKRTSVVVGQYAAVWVLALGLGYLSSQPAFKKYYDATTTKRNTITPHSQDIVARLDGPVTITSYVNLLDSHFWIGMPERILEDRKLFEQYLRFKPDMRLKYVYYYHEASNPMFDERFPNLTVEEKFKKMIEINGYDPNLFMSPEEFAKLGVDLSGENYRFVREIEYKGKRTFLRVFDDNMIFPTEAETSAALKRLVMELPKVGFLSGNGARATDGLGERSYSIFAHMNNFRHSLVNQGFDYADVPVGAPIPEDIDILVIAELREPLTPEQLSHVEAFITKGGNLFIAGEPNRGETMNPIVELIGYRFGEGCIVHPTAEHPADLIVGTPTPASENLSYHFGMLRSYRYGVVMPSVAPIDSIADLGFTRTTILSSDTLNTWQERVTTNFVDDSVHFEPALGEAEGPFPLAIGLQRKVGDKEQKIVLLGDADCISNGEITRTRTGINAFNYYMITGGFGWLSDGEVPVDIRRPSAPDTAMKISESSLSWVKAIFAWGMPGAFFIIALFIWLRRRGR